MVEYDRTREQQRELCGWTLFMTVNDLLLVPVWGGNRKHACDVYVALN